MILSEVKFDLWGWAKHNKEYFVVNNNNKKEEGNLEKLNMEHIIFCKFIIFSLLNYYNMCIIFIETLQHSLCLVMVYCCPF